MTDYGMFTERIGYGPEVTRERLVQQGPKYLCWDSFKARWYYGPRHLSERLSQIRAEDLAAQYNGRIVAPPAPAAEQLP